MSKIRQYFDQREQILTFIWNQLWNERGEMKDNRRDMMDIKLEWIISREKGAKRYMNSACRRTTVHRKRGKNAWKKKHFLQTDLSSVGRLVGYLLIHHEWECRLRWWYGCYTCPTGQTPTSFRSGIPLISRTILQSSFTLITPFWFVSRDKAGTCPQPLCSPSRGRSTARARPSALFNDATGSSHELFIAAC